MIASAPHRPVGGRRGFTLIEIIVALVILSLVMGAVVRIVNRAQHEYVRQRGAGAAEQSLLYAETMLGTILQAARANPYGISGPLLDADPLNHGTFDNVRVVGDYNPADGDVLDALEDVQFHVQNDTLYARWQAGGGVEPLIYPVTSLQFLYYDSAGAAITTKAAAANAFRVEYRIAVGRGPFSSQPARRSSSVNLWN